MNRSIIFHVPMHLSRNQTSASEIRPFKIIKAFQNIGYDVDVVEGYAIDRKRQIAIIKGKINNGHHYDFMYSESSTMPTLLTEKNHLPTYPFLDFNFFHFCKAHNIPIGLFYRDIHWLFINKNRGWKQRIAKYFYRYDLRQYEKYVDVLFLPTIDMYNHIPFSFKRNIVELPSGCDIHLASENIEHKGLEILYVGGINGNYNLQTFMSAVSENPDIHLTVCCRNDDWMAVRSEYEQFERTPNITIVHKNGDDLKLLYEQADVFSLLFETSSQYLQFAAPFKLFEAIGYGKPLIGYRKNWSGKFIEEHGIGMACDSTFDDVTRSLHALCENKMLIRKYKERLSEIAPAHTWENRCRLIDNMLTKIKK